MHILIQKEKSFDGWTAGCLEHDFVATGATKLDAYRNCIDVIASSMFMSMIVIDGKQYSSWNKVPPAPKKDHNRYKRAQPFRRGPSESIVPFTFQNIHAGVVVKIEEVRVLDV